MRHSRYLIAALVTLGLSSHAEPRGFGGFRGGRGGFAYGPRGGYGYGGARGGAGSPCR